MAPETLAALVRLAAAALSGPLADAGMVNKLRERLTSAQKATSPSFQLALLAAEIARTTHGALTSEAPPRDDHAQRAGGGGSW